MGLEAVGPLADDGVPEPLTVLVGEGASLMLVPTGGYTATFADPDGHLWSISCTASAAAAG